MFLMHFLPRLADAVVDAPTDRLDCDQEVESVYARHADFVWYSLQKLGVPAADLEDAFQEVFVVVQRRLSSFEGRSKMSTWLFGICLRIAKHERRLSLLRGFFGVRDADPIEPLSPEHVMMQRQAQNHLERILSRLTPEQRAIFVMFEFENLDCAEIARTVGVPIGTVYSRLHAARERFRQAHERHLGTAERRRPK
jgi:RNA polymerase sigma-70 factor (ECF subfamily)